MLLLRPLAVIMLKKKHMMMLLHVMGAVTMTTTMTMTMAKMAIIVSDVLMRWIRLVTMMLVAKNHGIAEARQSRCIREAAWTAEHLHSIHEAASIPRLTPETSNPNPKPELLTREPAGSTLRLPVVPQSRAKAVGIQTEELGGVLRFQITHVHPGCLGTCLLLAYGV